MWVHTMTTNLTLPHTNAAIRGLEETNVSITVENCWIDCSKGSRYGPKRRSPRLKFLLSISETSSTTLDASGTTVFEKIAYSSGVRSR